MGSHRCLLRFVDSSIGYKVEMPRHTFDDDHYSHHCVGHGYCAGCNIDRSFVSNEDWGVQMMMMMMRMVDVVVNEK